MADNYLEQRMDDLRSGKLSGNLRQTAVLQRKSGVLQIPFPPKRVLVTGGANGIGLAIARAFIKTGSKVAIFDKDAETGKKLAHDEGFRFHNVDVSDSISLEKELNDLLKTWKDLDIIVSNAGVSRFIPLEESTDEYFEQIIGTNLRPAYIIGRTWAKHRRKFPSLNSYVGRFIVISSTRHIMSEKSSEGYAASKGGLASLNHALMMSLSEFRITVNSISPGWIHTGDPKDLTDADHMQHPSRRVGNPEDISRVVMFLSLPDNDFINGTDIVVDGGMTRKMIYV